MFYQVFGAYCKTAQLMMLIQQEMLRQWINQWSLATASRNPCPEGSSEVNNKNREVLDTQNKSGIRAIEAASRITEAATRTTEAASRITEAASRLPEAPASSRHHGNGDAHTAPDAPAPRTGEGATIQLHAEELQAHKQRVETGAVRVRKEVVTEHRTIEVPVQREEIVIERRAPTGEPIEEIRIPVSEEQVTVEKRLVVKEEVTVGKRVVESTERVGGEVRKEVVRVEREGDVDIHQDGTGKE
ncbi:MAG: YsnF/AvaK domain-containing protein [Isosphaeraceae bacterium]